MINILPNNDLKEHIEDTTCECNPNLIFENGEMIVIHNSYDGREWKEQLSKEHLAFLESTSFDLSNTIYENTQLFVNAYNKGELEIQDLEEMLNEAEDEEEFEVAVSLRDAINIIKEKKS